MRNTTRNRNRPDNRPCEVHATICLPKGQRINIDRVLKSILDALDDGVGHIDAVFIRVYRGAGKAAAEVSVISKSERGGNSLSVCPQFRGN